MIRRARLLFDLALARPFVADSFEAIYALKRDPWSYRTSDFEREKYRNTLAALPRATYPRGLEVGCAEGVFTEQLAPRVQDLTAVDVSATAIGRARAAMSASEHVKFARMDVEVGDPGGKFDLIVVSEVLYYLRDVARIGAAAARLSSWLEPGGHLVLCHMRRQSDESEGAPVPWWSPPHPGAFTVHQIFADLPGLSVHSDASWPLYRITVFTRDPDKPPSVPGIS